MVDVPNRPDQINMLWIGPELGPLEKASVISFLEAGHPVDLYTYTEVAGIPNGVKVRSASEILPWEKISALRYPSGSYALGANYFRILLQKKELGYWADMDLICLKKVQIDGEYVAGWEDGERINNAFIRISPTHPVVADLIKLYERGGVPSWATCSKRDRIRLKILSTLGYDVRSLLPWGTYGVQALTSVSLRYGVQPQNTHVFYPLHWRDADALFEPNRVIDEYLKEDTLTFHLWNEIIRKRLKGGEVPPKSSILGRILARYL